MNLNNYINDEREKYSDIKEQNKYVLARIIYYISSICEKYNLNYSVGCGTMLGAIREKDVIAWDLDADIYMDCRSFIKFLEIAKDELPDDLYFQYCETDPLFCSNHTFCRVVDLGSSIKPSSDKRMSPNGIHSDIQCINDDKALFYELLKKDNLFMFVKKILCNIFYPILYFITSFDYKKTFYQMIGYGWYIAFFTYFVDKKTESKRKNPYNIMDTEKKEFRDFYINVPKKYDEYLKGFYGDYMSFPSEESIERDMKKIYPTTPFNPKNNIVLRKMYGK